jgi:hypothetical protein
MKKSSLKKGMVGVTIVAVTIIFCFSALAAEKKKFVMAKTSKMPASPTYLHDRTDQKYRITQWSRVDIITEHSDPSLIGAEQTVYGQSDFRAFMDKGDGGVSWGYHVTRSKDGDCLYGRWESTWRLTVAHFSDWVSEGESKFQIFGGTGKYLNAKGSGICRSKTTAQGETVKCEGEWDF